MAPVEAPEWQQAWHSVCSERVNMQMTRITLWRRPNPLEWIAFWQLLGFLLLLGVVWVDQVLDLQEVFFGVSRTKDSWQSAAILTVAIVIVGFITIAHTFVQQRHVLHGFLRVCTYCKRIKLDNQKWEQMEKYVSERTRAEFSHGICPECFRRTVAALEAQGLVAPEPAERKDHV
jgi:hypothetical protein